MMVNDGALGVGWLGTCTRLHFQTAWQLALRYGGLYGGAVGAWAWARAGSFAMGIAGYQWQW